MTVRDYEHQLRLEISENENRKEFSFSERVEWAKRLEQIEKIKAKENMSKGGQGLQNFANLNANEIVAKESGFGNKETYRQAKFIAENADPEIVKQLDEKQISIHSAYQKIKLDLEQKDKALTSLFKMQANTYLKIKRFWRNLSFVQIPPSSVSLRETSDKVMSTI